MERSLEFAEDKLLAISAITTTLHQMFGNMQGHIVYLVGVFIDFADPFSRPSSFSGIPGALTRAHWKIELVWMGL
jgi:hypothetical protein